MPALAIKSWKASDSPFDDKGTMVLIQGREGGIIAWLLALVGVDPVSSWRITRERVELDDRSWSGTNLKIVPLENIDYIFYGYHKPWRQSLVLFLAWILLVPLTVNSIAFVIGMRGFTVLSILAYIAAIPVAVIYYILTRSFRLGFAVTGGREFDMKFKRSIIENQEINAKEAAYVCEMLDYLCDCRRHPQTT